LVPTRNRADDAPLHLPRARRFGPERLIDGGPIIRRQRLRKTDTEIAIIQYAMNLTLEVHRRVHALIRPGIRARSYPFTDDQHRAGAEGGSSLCIVSFGEATSLPHGADGDQTYQPGDVVLVDTGCRIDGYHSDLTRTYMLDETSSEFARIWAIEREAQQAVFDAARLGAPCESLDAAARAASSATGSGRLGCPPAHRAGHGLDRIQRNPISSVATTRLSKRACAFPTNR
jgi:Xaa-Pro dipeptidase